MGQIHRIQTGVPDRAPISAASVAVIKGVLFALSVLALIATLRAKPDTDGDGKVQFAVAQSHFKPSLSADPHHSESSFDV